MTVAELERAIQSKNRIRRVKAQEQASYDYLLAGLIGRNVAAVLDNRNKVPTLYEAYPTLFDDVKEQQEEQIKQQKMELSALRFRQFAQSYNNNLDKEVPKKINE